MHLVVHIPYQTDQESSQAMSLARRAPSYTTEWVNDQKMAIAIFTSLPVGIGLALQLVGEAIELPGAWASIDSKRISSLAKLWQRLNCYRDSLNEPDRQRYCLEKTAFFNTLVGCEGQRCPASCQFFCTPCMRMTQDQSTIDVENRFDVAAELAEVAWCPNLGMPWQVRGE